MASISLSEAEAFSLVVLEALAVGTPVVVGGAPGLLAWQARFPGAVLAAAAPGPAAVAEAVARLEGLRVRVDLGAYEWASIVARYRQVYAEVVA